MTRLRQACLAGPEFRLRDSAAALVQVCAEFAPVPELSWLGLPAGQVEGARGRLRHAVTNARDLETVERIAAALGDLRGLSRGLPAPDAAFEEAVATGGLVLRGSPRIAYWQKQRINQEWRRYDSPWQLLWRLADRARLGAAVGCRDLYDDGVVDSTVHNRWRRLKALLPPTLAREVEPGTERATYRLKLGAAQIHLFPAGPEERPAGAEGTTV